MLETRANDRTTFSAAKDTFGHIIQPPGPGRTFRLNSDSEIARQSAVDSVWVSHESGFGHDSDSSSAKLFGELPVLVLRKKVSSVGSSSQIARSLEHAEIEDDDESSSCGIGRDPLAAMTLGSVSESDGVLPTCFRFNDPDLESTLRDLESRSRVNLVSSSCEGCAAPASIVSHRLLKNETACSRTCTTRYNTGSKTTTNCY